MTQQAKIGRVAIVHGRDPKSVENIKKPIMKS